MQQNGKRQQEIRNHDQGERRDEFIRVTLLQALVFGGRGQCSRILRNVTERLERLVAIQDRKRLWCVSLAAFRLAGATRGLQWRVWSA